MDNNYGGRKYNVKVSIEQCIYMLTIIATIYTLKTLYYKRLFNLLILKILIFNKNLVRIKS